MNGFLLNTHTLIWSQLEPQRLRPGVMATLDDGQFDLWFSPVSVWELISLTNKGRVHLGHRLDIWIGRLADRFRLREAPLSTVVVLHSASMKFEHRDPVDRFLAATAAVHGLTLVTADLALLARTDISVLAAC